MPEATFSIQLTAAQCARTRTVLQEQIKDSQKVTAWHLSIIDDPEVSRGRAGYHQEQVNYHHELIKELRGTIFAMLRAEGKMK